MMLVVMPKDSAVTKLQTGYWRQKKLFGFPPDPDPVGTFCGTAKLAKLNIPNTKPTLDKGVGFILIHPSSHRKYFAFPLNENTRARGVSSLLWAKRARKWNSSGLPQVAAAQKHCPSTDSYSCTIIIQLPVRHCFEWSPSATLQSS